MLLLEAGNIKKHYADRLILEFDELKIHTGDRIGIVGMNGSGKTTLLDILSGSLEPDEGYVKQYCEIGYIRQFDEESQSEPSQKLLKEFELSRKLDREDLSGGEHTRLKLVNAFSKDRLLLFADEPTSNLDYKGIELLGRKLERQESFVLVSHDRTLLDTFCNRVLEVKDGKIRLFSGNYSFYRECTEREAKQAETEYEKYVEKKGSLEAAIANRQNRAKSIRKAPKRMGNSEARLHKRSANEIQEKLHSSASMMMTRLEKLEVKEKPRELPKIKLDFSLTNPPEGKIILTVENLSFRYDDIPLLEQVGFQIRNGFKTALWGENGAGKTTLLNLIYQNKDSSIHISPKARLAYFCQGFENLDWNRSVLENVMKESVQKETIARTILARLLLQGDSVHKKMEVLSGGERIKVAFAKMFVSGANVLLLDEPTNFLDMPSIEALQGVLKEYEGTVLFVSHDRTFVNSVADRLLLIGNRTVREFDGKLEEYEKKNAVPDTAFGTAIGKALGTASGDGTVPVKSPGIPENLERTMLQMKLTETISRMSAPNCNKETLEEEYNRLVALLRQK